MPRRRAVATSSPAIPGRSRDRIRNGGEARLGRSRSAPTSGFPRSRLWLFLLLPSLGLAAGVGACGGEDGLGPEDVLDTVDLEALFASPEPQEISRIEEEWAERPPQIEDVRVEASTFIFLDSAKLQLFSHRVDRNRHYGAVLAPVDAPDDSTPVLVFAHGGEGGTSDDDVVRLKARLGLGARDFVMVAPAYRAEPLRFRGELWQSGGSPDLWDGDVDDALSLLEVALREVSAADPERIVVLGMSRGGTVGLLMGIRDPRIRAVTAFFPVTDLFGPFVEEIAREILAGSPPDLPGVEALRTQVLGPLREGRMSLSTARLELLKRSPVHFVRHLPRTQLHHGVDDAVVPVGETEAVMEAMARLGRGPPEFEAHLYPEGFHHFQSLPGSFSRTREFLLDAVGVEAAEAR